jgi:hypothetical protein
MSGVALLGAIALFLPACASGGGSRATGDVPQTEVGATFMGDNLKLTKIEGPDGGQMTFTITNVGGQPMEDLTARVLFYLPPTGIQTYDTEAVEQPFSAFADENIRIVAAPRGSSDIKGWALYVQPAVTVSRAGDVKRTGSMFLSDALECVDIVDQLTAETPAISFTIENLTEEAQDGLEYQVVLTKEGVGSWNSGWLPVTEPIEPGGAIQLTPDVSGSSVTGMVSVLLKIQRSVL